MLHLKGNRVIALSKADSRPVNASDKSVPGEMYFSSSRPGCVTETSFALVTPVSEASTFVHTDYNLNISCRLHFSSASSQTGSLVVYLLMNGSNRDLLMIRTHFAVEEIQNVLLAWKVKCIHGDYSQLHREKAKLQFKYNAVPVLVATRLK